MVSIKDLSWQSGLKLTGLPFCFQRSEMDKVQLRSYLEILMFAPKAQPDGSQTFYVWSESTKQSRSEGAPEILPALKTRGMLDGLFQTCNVWLPSRRRSRG
jgi:hypothetical protein